MKSDHLVLDSSCLRRARLSLFFACLPPKTLRNQLESWEYLLLSVVFLLQLRTFPLGTFSSRDILAFKKSRQCEIWPAKLTNHNAPTT